MLRRLTAALLPDELGRDFRSVLASTAVANLADGVLLAAGPLLVASLTREPFLVALAVLLQRVPWVLFGVFAGAVIDRLDRRRLMIVVNLLRAAILGTLAGAIALDALTLPLVYAVMFAVGTSETFADNAGSILIAVTVPKRALGLANARIFGASTVMNHLAGPPLGAFLFGVGLALPFTFNAVCLALAAALLTRISLRPEPVEERARLRSEVAEGLRWLWGNAPVRTLAIMITTFNVTFGAAFSVWVLYAYERLGLDEVGFGLLMTASAVGGLIGSAAFRRLERRFRYAVLLRTGLIIETLTHVAMASTTNPFVAGGVMVAFGAHAVIWGTTSTTVRHRAVPERLLGRVTSVYMIGSVGAIAMGTAIGGAVAQQWGVVAPFWFAAAGCALTIPPIWGSLAQVAHAAEVDEAEVAQPPPEPPAPERTTAG